MKRLLNILPILALIVAGCNREPFADATVDLNPAYVGELVRFTSYSTNADHVEWDMGDGNFYNGSIVDHYFVDPGSYDVQLKAFGRKGGVSTAIIPMEVIGAILTVEVREYYDEYLVPSAQVRLYPTLNDWINETNLSAEGYTNASGRVTFDNLSYQRYYVDIWEAYHDNYMLASEDTSFITSPLMDNDYIWIFYVDYYPDGKKSTARTTDKSNLMNSDFSGVKRDLKENKITLPRR
ncbi:MAG: PKD domain-containing protein [Bacteroidales bacterium]